MPRDTNTKICSQKDITCYDSAEDLLMMKELNQSLETRGGENKHGKTLCNCLPSCTSIKYDFSFSKAEIIQELYFLAMMLKYLKPIMSL